LPRTGKIVNTNLSYMSQKLEDVGLAVQWETTVGDHRGDLLPASLLHAKIASRRNISDKWLRQEGS
jgi:molybdopterin-biosynthesis enzyme MoeA-like protein